MKSTKKQVGPKYRPITSEYLDYDEVMDKYKDMMKWLAQGLCKCFKYHSLQP